MNASLHRVERCLIMADRRTVLLKLNDEFADSLPLQEKWVLELYIERSACNIKNREHIRCRQQWQAHVEGADDNRKRVTRVSFASEDRFARYSDVEYLQARLEALDCKSGGSNRVATQNPPCG